MCDVHPGKYGAIGLTMTLKDKVTPYLVGVDIGCGITTIVLKNKRTELSQLDKVIQEKIPTGFKIHKKAHIISENFDFTRLHCYQAINENKARCSLGTLGGVIILLK